MDIYMDLIEEDKVDQTIKANWLTKTMKTIVFVVVWKNESIVNINWESLKVNISKYQSKINLWVKHQLFQMFMDFND
jgi:hypothetical protein